jgi:hypothetical protein
VRTRHAPLHQHQLLELAGGVSSAEERAWAQEAEQVVRGRGGGVLYRAVLAVRRRQALEELQQVMTVHDSERSSRSTVPQGV